MTESNEDADPGGLFVVDVDPTPDGSVRSGPRRVMLFGLSPPLQEKVAEALRARGYDVVPAPRSLPEAMEWVERFLLAQTYQAAHRVKTEAARILGLRVSSLYYKLEKYGFIQKEESESENRYLATANGS